MNTLNRKPICNGRNRAVQRSRGVVAVEYAFLLVVVAVPTIFGVYAGGVQLLSNYDQGRAAIIGPAP
jgi:hypothetical protein